MRLARMGSFHPHRLSFMRVLLRRLRREHWRFDRPVFALDRAGVGRAVYSAHGPERSYSLVVFAHDLPDDQRSDRVIATAWDATFTLFDGVPTAADLDRLAANVPLQEAGRLEETELSLSRANRSVRLFEHVVERLAAGAQPDPDRVDAVGYLMRTTAVYGSGKFGAADRQRIADRPELATPFQVEMLAVYLIRAFVLDLVEHLARARAPGTAVPLEPGLRRRFGIGNSTGLGMAPFLITHPVLLHHWIAAREEAFARVRGVEEATEPEEQKFRALFRRARRGIDQWRTEHPVQVERLRGLREDLDRLETHLATADLRRDHPWERLWAWTRAHLGLEAQEWLVSLSLEPYEDRVDPLASRMGADEIGTFAIDGSPTIGEFREQLARDYGWALALDWESPARRARAWYISEEKLEPRLGDREAEGLDPYEQPLAPGRDVAALHADLATEDPSTSVADFLFHRPEHRHAVRRVQQVASFPYAEIRDNTIDAELLPIDLLRAKLSFFGATHFDPRSDRWVRINMFRNAPFPEELATAPEDDWAYPPLED